MEYKMKCLPGVEPRIDVTDDFIDKNKLSINKQVVKDILNAHGTFLGFEKEVAIEFLPFEDAKPFLSSEYIRSIENGQSYYYVSDTKEATQDFLDYMVFAWMKAMDERGISASRSIIKLSAWMKILGRKDISEVLESNELYFPYGRPALRKCCEMLDIEYPEYL